MAITFEFRVISLCAYNILYICRYTATYGGSFIPSIARLGAKLSAHHNVCYLFPEESRERAWLAALPVPSEQILFCPFTPGALFRFCRNLSCQFHRESTLVHTHFMGGAILAAVNLCFKSRIHHYHMFVPPVSSAADRLRRFVQRINHRSSVTICVSNTLQDALQSYLPGAAVVCVPNGVDFEALQKTSAQADRPGCWAAEGFSILIHGSHFYWKGVDLAVKAVLQLNTQGDRCILYITSGDRAFMEQQLRPLTENRDCIRVIPATQDVRNLYDHADLMLSPSRFDAFGYSIPEAAFCGCQVIASDIPGPNMLRDIPGIRWVESGSVPQLCQAIRAAMAAKADGSAAAIKPIQREYVVQHHGIDIWTRRILALYQEHFHIPT